jgi:hypothetical protein
VFKLVSSVGKKFSSERLERQANYPDRILGHSDGEITMEEGSATGTEAESGMEAGLPDLGKPSLPPSPKFTATWRPFTATKFFTTAIFTAILPYMGRSSLKR